MTDRIAVQLTQEEISLLLQWMYRAGASGPAASNLITKLQDAKRSMAELKKPGEQ